MLGARQLGRYMQSISSSCDDPRKPFLELIDEDIFYGVAHNSKTHSCKKSDFASENRFFRLNFSNFEARLS